jgi:hypothetical protein
MLNISMRMAMIMAVIFGAVSLYCAVTAFMGIGDIADPAQASDARGFAWFWTFLASIAIGLGVLAWWLERGQRKSGES